MSAQNKWQVVSRAEVGMGVNVSDVGCATTSSIDFYTKLKSIYLTWRQNFVNVLQPSLEYEACKIQLFYLYLISLLKLLNPIKSAYFTYTKRLSPTLNLAFEVNKR